MSERLDRLEALAETILLAIRQQQQQRQEDRQEFRETVADVVSMIGTLGRNMDTMQAQVTEMQNEVRGLQTQSNRILEHLFNQQQGN